MKRLKIGSILISIILFLQIFLVVSVSGSSITYVLPDERGYRIRTTYNLANTGSYSAYNIKITVRIGADSNSRYQKNLDYYTDPQAKTIRRDAAGNIYAEISIDELKAGEKKTIAVNQYFTNSGLDYSDNIYEADSSYMSFSSNPMNQAYLQPGEKIESTAKEIIKKAQDFNKKQTKIELARDIYDFVNLSITYDSNPKYANKGALSALQNKRGVCDEYASLFTALCRAVGIPSRVVTGYWVDEAVNSREWLNISDKRHAWAEFYIEGLGWIPVEPTLQYTYNGTRKPNYDYFANIKSGDRHFITGYEGAKNKSEISMYYTCYEDTTVDLKFGEERIIQINKNSVSSYLSDIGSSWAKPYIEKLYSSGKVFARKADLFEPASNISRAEFAAFLVNTLGLEAEDASIKFKDVATDHKLIYFIKTAAAYGLIKGDDLGYFRPEENISRQDAAVIMERALKLVNKTATKDVALDFSDKSSISTYAYDSVKLIYSMNIMAGKPNKLFDPKGYTTRAEAAKILDNFINAIN